MDWHQDRSFGFFGAVLLSAIWLALVGLVFGPTVAMAQHPAAATALVFDRVTVIDVEHGNRIPEQRVVVAGNRIKAVGAIGKVRVPKGALVIDARGKYLIPGLWDMHTHSDRYTDFFYPLFIASGVTGIRDAGSSVPIDTLILWRREILSGTRVGPPRQILSGQSIAGPQARCKRSMTNRSPQTCIADSADAVHYVDSLKAAGADMIKLRDVKTKAMYLTIAAEARRQGIPFGGHITWGQIGDGLTYLEASDSGARIIDHDALGVKIFNCWGPSTTIEQCQPIAERFRRNGTWWVPTLIVYRQQQLGPRSRPVYARLNRNVLQYWSDSVHKAFSFTGALSDSVHMGTEDTRRKSSAADSFGYGAVAQRVSMPILAGTDVYPSSYDGKNDMLPGFSLHEEFAIYAAEGLTPLTVLQSATLSPAKFLHGTDSLGTVAPGKLADLVLLDADPLENITNTTTIRAVVANGHYFDRAALDQLLTEVQAKARQKPYPS